MATFSRGQGRLRLNAWTSCPLSQPMSPPSFVQITKIDWEKSAKIWFFKFKMGAISQSVEQMGPNFALHSGTTRDMYLQNIIGISAKLRALGSGQRFLHTFWILRRWRLQTNQTYIGPTVFMLDLIIQCTCIILCRMFRKCWWSWTQ